MSGNGQQTVPGILLQFAHLLGAKIKNGRLDIPEKYGGGYCAGFVLNENMRMLISNYQLNNDLLIPNPEINVAGRMIFFKFRNVFPKTQGTSGTKHLLDMPSVLVATSRINTDEMISIHSNTATINIEVDAGYLNKLLDTTRSQLLQSLLQNTKLLLFEQVVYPSLQRIVDEITTEPVDETFKLFFLRIKAEELICRLLMELEKREERHLYPLNSNDIKTIYKVREQMLERLEVPPVIDDLATFAAMSPTKLKRLFRQVFGNSIFSYYQQCRMKEAARLLKEEKMSVSAVGYQLGFTNLSHFSNVFKDHLGMKPKQYSQISSGL